MSEMQVPSSSRDATTHIKSEVQHGRTDGRTYEELLTADYQETAVTPTRAYKDFDSEPVRIGLIPKHVRAAVWYRDQGQCSECLPEWQRDEPRHLDHIVPWSAGGADTTDNLRLLCETHNLERSNYVDFAQPKRPATWWCANCYTLDEHLWRYDYPFVTCPRHGAGSTRFVRCRVGRAYMNAWKQGDERPGWHERPLLTSFEHVAYCAHCNAPGMTGVLL